MREYVERLWIFVFLILRGWSLAWLERRVAAFDNNECVCGDFCEREVCARSILWAGELLGVYRVRLFAVIIGCFEWSGDNVRLCEFRV